MRREAPGAHDAYCPFPPVLFPKHFSLLPVALIPVARKLSLSLQTRDTFSRTLIWLGPSTNHDTFHKLHNKFHAHSEATTWQTNSGANQLMNSRP